MAVGDGVVWNEALPDDDVVANQIDDYDRDLRVGVRSRMAREHIWSSSQTATNEGGHHRFVTFQAQTAAPTMAGTTAGGVYIDTTYALMFVNSGGVTATIMNSNGSMAVISGGTLGSIPICSSANANGLTILAGPTSTTASTHVLVSVNNATGGVQAATWAEKSTIVSSSALGTWASRSAATSYLAETDGFVTVYGTHPSGATGPAVQILTDAANPPTTVRVRDDTAGAGYYASATCPVRKGHYWKVILNPGVTATIYWLPMGE